MVPIDRTVETVPKTEIQTYVDSLLSFPSQVGINGTSLRQFPSFRFVRTFVRILRYAVAPGLVTRIAVDTVLVADHAVISTQFQVCQPGCIGCPGLGGDTPCAAYAPKSAPTIGYIAEFRGTVETDTTRDVIFVGVIVISAQKITFERFPVFTAADAGECTAGVVPKEIGERVEVVDQ